MTKEPIRSFRFQGLHRHVLSSLVDSTLYFAAPPKLNDPHDCQIDIEAAIRRASLATTGKRQSLLNNLLSSGLGKIMQEELLGNGVCSFSTSLVNAQMWTHYADSHRGICLFYEIPESFIALKSFGIMGWAPVKYGDNVLTDWLINELDETASELDASIEIIKMVLSTKGKNWSQEEEGRLLKLSFGPVEVPREYLKQICFGLRVDKADIRLVKKIVVPLYKDIEFAQIVLDTATDTGIQAVPLTP